jgi:hypothetical protein
MAGDYFRIVKSQIKHKFSQLWDSVVFNFVMTFVEEDGKSLITEI